MEISCTEYKGRLKAYRAERTKFEESGSITRVIGEISIYPRGFAFVNDVFVPPHLARGYESGQEVTVVAVMKVNKKTQKLGWTAICLADI